MPPTTKTQISPQLSSFTAHELLSPLGSNERLSSLLHPLRCIISARLANEERYTPSKTPTPPCYRQSDGRNAGVISAQLPQSLREKHPMCITSASLSLSLSRPHSHSLPRPTCCHADTSRVVMKQLRLRSIHFKMKTIKKKDVDKQSEFLLELGRQPTHILISISCSFGCFVNSSQGKSIKCWKKVKMCLISEAETGTFLAFWI